MNDRDPAHGQSQTDEKGSTECAPLAAPSIERFVTWDDEAQDWDISDNASPHGGKKPIYLPNRSGDRQIHFHLNVPADSTWQFDTNDPIWTADNVPCGSLNRLASDQITIFRPPQPRLLKVLDRNDGEARLIRYQLNFINTGSGDQPPPCDPTILNGGND